MRTAISGFVSLLYLSNTSFDHSLLYITNLYFNIHSTQYRKHVFFHELKILRINRLGEYSLIDLHVGIQYIYCNDVIV